MLCTDARNLQGGGFFLGLGQSANSQWKGCFFGLSCLFCLVLFRKDNETNQINQTNQTNEQIPTD